MSTLFFDILKRIVKVSGKGIFAERIKKSDNSVRILESVMVFLSPFEDSVQIVPECITGRFAESWCIRDCTLTHQIQVEEKPEGLTVFVDANEYSYKILLKV